MSVILVCSSIKNEISDANACQKNNKSINRLINILIHFLSFIYYTYIIKQYDIPRELLELYKNYAVRKAVEGIIKPLKSDGITKFKVKNNKKETIYEATKEDAIFFDAPPIPEEQLQTDIKTMYFSLVSISFKENNKWLLNDGNSTVNISIEDTAFIDKIKRNKIAFSCGDTLKCEVRITQKRTAAGLKTEYEILEVKEHKPAYKQLELF
jgi:hypothetical protein